MGKTYHESLGQTLIARKTTRSVYIKLIADLHSASRQALGTVYLQSYILDLVMNTAKLEQTRLLHERKNGRQDASACRFSSEHADNILRVGGYQELKERLFAFGYNVFNFPYTRLT